MTGAPNVPARTRYVVGSDDVIGLGTARSGQLNMTLFYTDPNDPRLRRSYISMNGREVMEMVLNANADGTVIQNNRFGLGGAWIREVIRIREIGSSVCSPGAAASLQIALLSLKRFSP
jgi:hypothetical protein